MVKTLEYQDASPLLDDIEILRHQFDEDGFAYFRGLLPATAVIELRRFVLEIFASRDWLAPGTELMDGIVDESIN
jgi:hypothetical protein